MTTIVATPICVNTLKNFPWTSGPIFINRWSLETLPQHGLFKLWHLAELDLPYEKFITQTGPWNISNFFRMQKGQFTVEKNNNKKHNYV